MDARKCHGISSVMQALDEKSEIWRWRQTVIARILSVFPQPMSEAKESGGFPDRSRFKENHIVYRVAGRVPEC